MDFDANTEQMSCIRAFVLLGITPCQTRDLEYVRTVSRNLLYRFNKHYTVDHFIKSETKEIG